MLHILPEEELLSVTRLPDDPVSVRVPLIVWVVPAVKVIGLPPAVHVKLLNVVVPDIVEVSVPVK